MTTTDARSFNGGESILRVKKIAREWIAHNMQGQEWPEDDWHDLTDDLDINLWLQENNNGREERRASAYPVVEGFTQPDIWVNIPLDGLNV